MNLMKNRVVAASLAVGAVALMMAEPSFASLGDVAKSVEKDVTSFKSLALQIGFLIGIIAFITGLYLFWKDSKQPNQDHGKKGLIAVIVGSCLLVAPWLLGQGVGSLGGTEGDASNNVKTESGF
jgi:H+/Cl- antiporter ClcA